MSPRVRRALVRSAIAAGAEAGYDPAVYEVTRVEWRGDDASWWILSEHEAPAPPGGHFSVRVDGESGEATLRRGE